MQNLVILKVFSTDFGPSRIISDIFKDSLGEVCVP
jgi:hypothetical protein